MTSFANGCHVNMFLSCVYCVRVKQVSQYPTKSAFIWCPALDLENMEIIKLKIFKLCVSEKMNIHNHCLI